MIPKIQEFNTVLRDSKFSITQLSRLTLIGETTLRKIQKGKTVSDDTAMKVSYALKVSATEIFEVR